MKLMIEQEQENIFNEPDDLDNIDDELGIEYYAQYDPINDEEIDEQF